MDGEYRLANLSPARTVVYQRHPYRLVATLAARTLTRRNETPRRIVDISTRYTIERAPSLDVKDRDMRKGFSEQIDVQCLASGVAVNLTAWTSVKVQTSPDGSTWTDRTTTVVTAASGLVRAVLSTTETAALDANSTIRVRVSGVDAALLTRCFPDDADLDLKLRVST